MSETQQLVETICAGPHPAPRNLITEYEKRLIAQGTPLVDLPTIHRHTPGLYIREVKMKAGVIYTTRIHKTTHPFVVSSGRVTVFHADGSAREIRAPHTGITKPGAQRAILCHEDCIWTTFHPNPTGEENIEQLEAMLVEPWAEHLRDNHSRQPAVESFEERKEIT